MEIIAAISDGFLVKATTEEIASILTAVNGKTPSDFGIGQKIPAIDYASTIEKVKFLKSNRDYKAMLDRRELFNKTVDQLQESIEKAGSIEI